MSTTTDNKNAITDFLEALLEYRNVEYVPNVLFEHAASLLAAQPAQAVGAVHVAWKAQDPKTGEWYACTSKGHADYLNRWLGYEIRALGVIAPVPADDLPGDAAAGVSELLNVIECLRDTGEYYDGEGEATDRLEALAKFVDPIRPKWTQAQIDKCHSEAKELAKHLAVPEPTPVPADDTTYLHLARETISALKRLSFAAQTSGGTAGPDEELQAAIAQAEQALSLSACSRAIDAAAPEPIHASDAPVTDAMVDSYLKAQGDKVKEVDDKWGGNIGKAPAHLHPVHAACRAGLSAALAARPAPAVDAAPADRCSKCHVHPESLTMRCSALGCPIFPAKGSS